MTFTKVETSASAAPGNSNLNIALSQVVEPDSRFTSLRGTKQSSTIDNAIVSFNEGSELPKFDLLEGHAKLYIPQGNEEYAIAFSEGQGEMPLNFMAKENGQYTPIVNPKGVEMAYLHLIDNMTGADIDLLDSPSYTFTASTTDFEGRFKLVFAYVSENEDGDNDNFAFFSNGNIIVNGTGTLQVINILGRQLSSQEIHSALTSSNTSYFLIQHSSFAPGLYVLRLINGDDVRTQKMVISQ